MSKIFRIPRGLSSYLDVQNMGKPPSELSQVVVPTFDMDKLYDIEKLRWVQQAGTALGARGVFGGSLIPVGKCYLVRSFNIRFTSTPTVATAGNGTISIFAINMPNQISASGEKIAIAEVGSFGPGVHGDAVLQCQFERPIPLLANTLVSAQLSNINYTGGGVGTFSYGFTFWEIDL